MSKYKLEQEEKQIVRAVIRSDNKRTKRQQDKENTVFDDTASRAIEKAKLELDLGNVSEDVRQVIIKKIYDSLLYNTPWELIGETYCCRSIFYQYRAQFCYLVAVNMDLIPRKDKR